MMPRTLRAEVAPRVVYVPAETVDPPLERLNLRLRRGVRMAIEHALREGGMRGEGTNARLSPRCDLERRQRGWHRRSPRRNRRGNDDRTSRPGPQERGKGMNAIAPPPKPVTTEGTVLSVRGAVVDVRFGDAEAPAVNTAMIVKWARAETLVLELNSLFYLDPAGVTSLQVIDS